MTDIICISVKDLDTNTDVLLNLADIAAVRAPDDSAATERIYLLSGGKPINIAPMGFAEAITRLIGDYNSNPKVKDKLFIAITPPP